MIVLPCQWLTHWLTDDLVETWMIDDPYWLGNLLTLFAPVYLSVSKDPHPIYLGLVWVTVPNLFVNNLSRNDLPYSKGFMKFGWPEPLQKMIDF